MRSFIQAIILALSISSTALCGGTRIAVKAITKPVFSRRRIFTEPLQSNLDGRISGWASEIGGGTSAQQMFVVSDPPYAAQVSPWDAPTSLGGPTWFQAMADEGVLDEHLYSFFIDPSSPRDAEITLGGIDEERIRGDINLLSITRMDRGYFNTSISAIHVNGKNAGITGWGVNDISTGFMVAPSVEEAGKIYALISPKIKQLDCAGAWGLPCDDVEGLEAELAFTLGQKDYIIPSKELSLGPYPGKPGTCQTLIKADTTDEHKGGWLIGNNLLRYYYNVYDVGNNRFGLADTAFSPSRK